MKLQQVSENCFAVLNEKNLVCDANSGLINLGGGVVIDTQSDLPHARRMIELFGKVWRGMPKRVINTHEDGDHVWGNQLFEGAEIIAHRTVPDRMKEAADPGEMQHLLKIAEVLGAIHPGVLAIANQLREDYDFDGIELVLPTTLFDERYVLNLDGTEVHVIYVGPSLHWGRDRPRAGGRGGLRRRRRLQPVHPEWLDRQPPGTGSRVSISSSRSTRRSSSRGADRSAVIGATAMKAYLEFVRDESRPYFD